MLLVIHVLVITFEFFLCLFLLPPAAQWSRGTGQLCVVLSVSLCPCVWVLGPDCEGVGRL